jgi:hypothetical protein
MSCTKLTDGSNEPMADLIIENIEFLKSDYDSLDASWLYTFSVYVKNIGDKSVNSALFVMNTRNAEDYDLGRFTHGERINYDSLYIYPDSTLIDTTTDRIAINAEFILFKIAAKGDTTNHGYELSYAIESDYENNFFILDTGE